MTQRFSLSPIQLDEASGLAYRLRLPTHDTPRALAVLLHGLGSHEQDLAELAASFAEDVLVVLPRGPIQLAPGQYGWFRVAFTPQGPQIVVAEAESSRRRLIDFLAQMQADHGITPAQTLLAGFSQGGIMSASVGLSQPEQIGGFGLLSGRILPELEPQLASPARLRTLQAFISHGEFDSKLPIQWARAAEQLLNRLGVQHISQHYPADHEITPTMHADFIAWAEQLLDASPRSL
ncbi:alpha/beta hydrolase [Uliginosibacterium gangwonense]|uniref:alpha/beta hydrolase n=1 Tax=Uliginosibacterium gangwonense TaxID=392736 RepID=UPI00037F6C4F|nr:PHB depolymerase family esterase [Uliginosibacterium gangwonense]